jgi:hypothetical protein
MEGHMMGFYAKYLNVTDDQKTQMKAVMQKERATLKPLMQQVHQMDQQLKPYEEGTYDAAKVQAAVAQQAADPGATEGGGNPHSQRTLPIAHSRSAEQVEGVRGQPRSAYAAAYAKRPGSLTQELRTGFA